MKHLKLFLRTLINNNACVEAGRTKEKKYSLVAIAFALLGLFLAVLPICVTGFKQQGSAWLDTGYTSNLDKAWKEFASIATSCNLSVGVSEDHELFCFNWNENFRDTSALVRNKNGDIISDPKYNLTGLARYVYRTNLNPNDNKTLTDFVDIYIFNQADNVIQGTVEQLLKNENPYSYNNDDKYLELQEDENGVFHKVERSTTLMVFGRNSFYCYLFQPNNITAKASFYGDYNNFIGDFVKFVVRENSTDKQIIDNLKDLSNRGYITIRWNNTWRQTCIILGVDAGIILFLGTMIFVLTRGKNNPYRIFTFWDAQKITYYAVLTPGILGLLGFLIPNMAMMMFILGAGVRVMWLNMRTLNYKTAATPK